MNAGEYFKLYWGMGMQSSYLIDNEELEGKVGLSKKLRDLNEYGGFEMQGGFSEGWGI